MKVTTADRLPYVRKVSVKIVWSFDDYYVDVEAETGIKELIYIYENLTKYGQVFAAYANSLELGGLEYDDAWGKVYDWSKIAENISVKYAKISNAKTKRKFNNEPLPNWSGASVEDLSSEDAIVTIHGGSVFIMKCTEASPNG